ncbi:MAG: hypothetical protein ACKVP5_20660 [Aestuariivirga sp.]
MMERDLVANARERQKCNANCLGLAVRAGRLHRPLQKFVIDVDGDGHPEYLILCSRMPAIIAHWRQLAMIIARSAAILSKNLWAVQIGNRQSCRRGF